MCHFLTAASRAAEQFATFPMTSQWWRSHPPGAPSITDSEQNQCTHIIWDRNKLLVNNLPQHDYYGFYLTSIITLLGEKVPLFIILISWGIQGLCDFMVTIKECMHISNVTGSIPFSTCNTLWSKNHMLEGTSEIVQSKFPWQDGYIQGQCFIWGTEEIWVSWALNLCSAHDSGLYLKIQGMNINAWAQQTQNQFVTVPWDSYNLLNGDIVFLIPHRRWPWHPFKSSSPSSTPSPKFSDVFHLSISWIHPFHFSPKLPSSQG